MRQVAESSVLETYEGEELENKKEWEENENQEFPLWKKCFAEAFGTGLIVMFGVGVVNTAIFTEAQQGIWQIAVVWGFGILIAIILTGPVSGAHLNPAVSLAFAIFRPDDFDRSLLVPYWVSQLLGAFFFSLLNYFIFRKPIDVFHEANGIEKFDDDNAIFSAMAFGEYFPNPGTKAALGWDDDVVNFGNSLYIEALGTFMLVMVIFAVTDERRGGNKDAAPFYIAFTVAAMISLWAPLNQAGFNPARDLGPRIGAAVLGWGKVAIPGPNLDILPYIIGPMIGGPIGGLFYNVFLQPKTVK